MVGLGKLVRRAIGWFCRRNLLAVHNVTVETPISHELVLTTLAEEIAESNNLTGFCGRLLSKTLDHPEHVSDADSEEVLDLVARTCDEPIFFRQRMPKVTINSKTVPPGRDDPERRAMAEQCADLVKDLSASNLLGRFIQEIEITGRTATINHNEPNAGDRARWLGTSYAHSFVLVNIGWTSDFGAWMGFDPIGSSKALFAIPPRSAKLAVDFPTRAEILLWEMLQTVAARARWHSAHLIGQKRMRRHIRRVLPNLPRDGETTGKLDAACVTVHEALIWRLLDAVSKWESTMDELRESLLLLVARGLQKHFTILRPFVYATLFLTARESDFPDEIVNSLATLLEAPPESVKAGLEEFAVALNAIDGATASRAQIAECVIPLLKCTWIIDALVRGAG